MANATPAMRWRCSASARADDVPAHRITRLRRQGERYFADGLRELPDSRRLAILAVCAVEWELFLADDRSRALEPPRRLTRPFPSSLRAG